MREIRRRLRALPRDRRRDIVLAIRQGREVKDPRDAALAIAWAEVLDAKRQTRTWPAWVMPRSRPSGSRTWAWLAHFAWITAYGLVTMPFTVHRMLSAYWNAPEAARKNRELLDRTS